MTKNVTRKPAATDLSSVDQIREIIFGQQIVSYNKRFDELEKRLTNSVAEIKSSMEKQFNAMHKLVDKHFDSASDYLAAESRARETEENTIKDFIQTLRMDSEEQLSNTDQQLRKALNELHNELDQTNKEISKTAKSNFSQLTKSLKSQGSKLDGQKVDRKELASFLQAMAGQMVGVNGSGD